MSAPVTYRFIDGEEIVIAEVPSEIRRAAVTIAFGVQQGPWWIHVKTARTILREVSTRLHLSWDERAAIAALIENEMNDGSSKFGKVGHGLVRLGSLLEKFDDDEPEIPYPDGAPEPNWWDDRIDPR